MASVADAAPWLSMLDLLLNLPLFTPVFLPQVQAGRQGCRHGLALASNHADCLQNWAADKMH